MNVKQLIEQLQKLPENTEVYVSMKSGNGPLEIGTDYPNWKNSKGIEEFSMSMSSNNFEYCAGFPSNEAGTIFFGE